jgi:hypothetical protein
MLRYLKSRSVRLGDLWAPRVDYLPLFVGQPEVYIPFESQRILKLAFAESDWPGRKSVRGPTWIVDPS